MLDEQRGLGILRRGHGRLNLRPTERLRGTESPKPRKQLITALDRHHGDGVDQSVPLNVLGEFVDPGCQLADSGRHPDVLNLDSHDQPSIESRLLLFELSPWL